MVQQSLFRVVIDTNTLFRGLVSTTSAAARVLRAAEKRAFIPLFSKPVFDEYRAVLLDEAVTERFPEITPRVVEIVIHRLRFLGDYVRSPQSRFEYSRDKRDEKFLELAISLKASHILSSDKDLLSLPGSRSEAGKQFRQRLHGVQVLDAGQFMQAYGTKLKGQ